MRYDKKIIFVTETGGGYDPELGEHIEPTIVKTKKMANITDLGTERSKVLFGDVKQGAKVVRLLRPYLKNWDFVLIGNDKYKIVTGRQLRLKNTFILQEVSQ
ncbi:Phage protein [Lactococcus lactis subsp. lactis]|uniref:Phage protein n=3 Tax=Lactococcus lactis TaxID=1358 RepID=A0A5M9Q047_LACLH|nr:hypothetical protein [Lactococcus lactis]KAA8701459.1 hypothetical protein F4V48_08910 [Lactococcus lactis subsp. hordniae]KSU05870.1 Phage protein [Lactococcus lactis subsp. lactis]MCT3135742.1 hypothetical protein [Lactococcus lactis]